MADPTADKDNKPSRIRDHLANERTYLAWLRTAANVMVLGLAIAKFADVKMLFSAAAGGLLILVGAAGLVYGTWRYRRINREIESGVFLTGTQGRGPLVSSVVLILAVLLALALLIVPGLRSA